MARNEFRVSRIARETGYDAVEAAILLSEAGFPVKDERSVLQKSQAKLARGFLFRAKGSQSPPRNVRSASEPQWPEPRPAAPISYLSVEQVIDIHKALTEEYRGTEDAVEPPGIRDKNGLESAVGRPILAAKKYHSLPLAAAALLHGLNANHAFHNGNKRTSLLSIAIFIEDLNRHFIESTEDELFKLVVDTARHSLLPESEMTDRSADPWFADREVLAIHHRLRKAIKAPDRRDKNLKWRDLRPLLENFGCEVGDIESNQAKIRRTSPDGRPLQVVTGARNQGDEIGSTDVKRIRKELELTDQYGIDSAIFYNEGRPHPDLPELIERYSGVLAKLAFLDRSPD